MNLMFKAYPEYSEGGYADKRTVRQGETITFYIASTLERCQARILCVERYPQPGQSGSDYGRIMKEVLLMNMNDPQADCNMKSGCDWKPTLTLQIPRGWRSGWYRVEFPVKLSNDLRYIDFIVAEAKPHADILFIFDMQTAQAYNVYGGGSLYGGFDATGRWSVEKRASQVSWRRPVVMSHTYQPQTERIANPVWIPHEEEAFRLWLESRYRVAYLSNDALPEFGLGYLQHYPLAVIVGQQEYWSNEQLELVKSYVLNGGRLYLSAVEFAYAALRHDRQQDLIHYYYDPREDPYFGSAPERLATVRAAIANVGDFFAVSMAYGIGLGISSEFSPLTIVNAKHPVFGNLGYKVGDALAGIRGLGVGAWVERNGAGTYRITSANISLSQVDILAIAPYPPLVPRQHGPPEHTHENFNHPLTDRLIHGEAKYTVKDVPEKTFAVAAFVRQGKGEMFVGPGGWFNLPHPYNQDPRTPQLIHRIVYYLLEV